MRVRVIPVEPRRVIGGEPDLVILRLSGSNAQKDVIRVAARRDSQAVGVQIRRLRERIREPDPDCIARVYTQRRRYVETVVGIEHRPLSGHGHRRWLWGERDSQDAGAAGNDRRLSERLHYRLAVAIIGWNQGVCDRHRDERDRRANESRPPMRLHQNLNCPNARR